MAGLTRTEKVDLLSLALTLAVIFYEEDPRRAELAMARGLQRVSRGFRAAGTWALAQGIRTENWAKEWAS